MHTLPRIIKRQAAPVEPAPEAPLEELIAPPQKKRIPAQQVHLWDEPELEDQPPLRHRILPRAAAAYVAEPFELPPLLNEPAFPLPDPEPVAEEEVNEPEPEMDPEARWAARLAEQEAAFEKRLAQAVEQARTEGYEAGYQAAETSQRAELEATITALREDADRLRAAWNTFIEETEPLLAHLAFTMATAILDAPLPAEVKEVAARALSAAIDELAGEPPLRIRLHPVDLLRLRETGLVDELAAAHPGLDWDTDESLGEGDWVVESPAAMIRHIKQELLQTLSQRLGLSSLDD